MVFTGEQQSSMARYLQMKRQMRAPRAAGLTAYSGTQGSYAEEACIRFFGDDRLLIPHKSFGDVFKTITGGGADYGVVPIENSTTGAINENYDLLIRYQASIVGEVLIPVHHCLLGVPGAKISDIQSVYSHEQGFYQSRDFLSKYPEWALVPYHNTAVAAKMVHDAGDKSKAAIASRRAAQIHHLDVLAGPINGADNNTTRFIVVSRMPENRPGRNKISLRFTLKDEPGALYHLLGIFDAEHLNLSKIESRPIPASQWHYQFFMDFIGDIDEDHLDAIIGQVMAHTRSFEFLGFYPHG